MKKTLFSLVLLIVVLSLSVPHQFLFVQAETLPQMDVPGEGLNTLPDGTVITSIEEVNPYFTIEHITLADGTALSKGIISGPSQPPAGYEAEREASIQPLSSRGVISNFPSYNWVFGCSAVSGAMIAAYYDQNGYPDIYTGPTNGSVMPITDTSWGTWSDGYATYPNNPLVASKDGLDGRSGRGSIDNYWVRYGSTADDPYITNGWPQHTWGAAIGDFMKTSQSAYGNTDGATSFYFNNSAEKLTCTDMESLSAGGGRMVSHVDGTYGRKLFYEARGYTVTDCYYQRTDYEGGFSLDNFKAEIDAGHPVMINLEGHTIVGYGYDGTTIYIRDTWDSDPNNTYTMTWGGSYQDMSMQAVSVVHLAAPPAVPTGVAASDGTYTDKVRVTWNASTGANKYMVFRNTSNTHTDEVVLTSNHSASPFDDTTATPGKTYYYWVKACNAAGCSGYSIGDVGYIAAPIPAPPSGVAASDGTYTDKVQVTWNASTGADIYQVFKNTSNTHMGEIMLTGNHPASPFDDTTAAPGIPYYYWVKACNPAGCSDYSIVDTGYRAVFIPAPPDGVAASDGTYPDMVQITWNASAGAHYYMVFRNTSDTHTGEIVLTDIHPASPFDDLTAEPGIPYYYWVKACNPAGCSDYSIVDTGHRGPLIPAPPDGVVASDGTYTDKVQVTWSANTGADNYMVFRNTSNTHTGEIVLTDMHPASPFDDITAEPGKIYYYWVKACNAAGCSDYSTVDTGYRAPFIPAPPGGVAASDGTYPDKVQVTWNASTGADNYKVFRNTSITHTGEIVLANNHPASPFDDITAMPGKTYYYWVKACNAAGCSDYSSFAIGRLGTLTRFELFVPLLISGGG